MPTLTRIKKTICPSCGRIEEKEEIFFLADVLEGITKEIVKAGIDGVKWCSICR